MSPRLEQAAQLLREELDARPRTHIDSQGRLIELDPAALAGRLRLEGVLRSLDEVRRELGRGVP